MKKKIFAYILLMMPALLMTSCLKDQEDKFADSATERASKYLANIREVLTSAEDGWVLNYYPDREQKYGGFAYTLVFDNQNVTVSSQIANDFSKTITSTYSLDNEDGPSIVFDTYNDYLHHFSTPTPSSGAGGYEAYDGDFIFIIMGVSEDKNTITLKGNRSGNIMYMHRLNGKDGETYLTEQLDVMNNMPTSYLIPDGAADKNILVTMSGGKVSFDGDTTNETVAYHYTTDGVEFYEPVTIQEHEITGITYIEGAEVVPAIGDESLLLYPIYLPFNQMFAGAEMYVAYSNFSPSVQEYLKACYDLSESEGEDIGEMVFVNIGAPYGYGLYFTSGPYWGLIALEPELIDDDKIKFTYNSTKNYSSGTWYYTYGYYTFIDYLTSTTFTLTTDSKVRPTYFVLTDDNDPVNYFKLVADPISDPFNN